MTLIPTSQKKPPIPVPGTVQVEMIYSHLGVIMENVYHVRTNTSGTTPTETQMDTIAAAFENWESTTGRGDRNSSCALRLIRVRDLSVIPGLVKEYVPVSNVTGSGTGSACPGNVTVAVRWSTGQGGRSFRGRTYVIGLQTNFNSGNQLTTAAQTQLKASYAALLSAVNAISGMKLVVVSYASNKFWRSTGLATPITANSVDPNMDSQRRRLTGRGT